ncbi:hypothetical protein [Amycolatopsis thermophila]|uniref:Uncharacterized protein n=1 Tax=Amycolatopsis thermophila TaxID=206084 RepID=A0ABU0F1L5_9PSEU|nr:hypothetical protein [Amycolatopsis thermophila]MDQ0381234.1 hypothetical protein [Amycolatopsis thermophila]
MTDTTRQASAGTGFADLICADQAWLDAEFAAIMTANFAHFPPWPPVRRHGNPGPRRPGRAPRTVAGRAGPAPVPAVRAGHRQRDPPC